MRAGPAEGPFEGPPRWCLPAAALAALVGLALLAGTVTSNSATYDETTYLQVATRWWRTGDQAAITRMGSPLTFWKLQQAPVLWTLDHTGSRHVVDRPHAGPLLIFVRSWSLTLWLVALVLTALWARRLYGPRAMALAAWLFALSPNLLAHGALVTMELPLVACTTGVFFLFQRFLTTGRGRFFWASAALSGLAFSCKFTTVLVPPLLGLVWWVERFRRGERGVFRLSLRVGGGMLAFVAVLLFADLAVTGCALLPLSEAKGAHPSLDGKFGPRLSRLMTRALELPIPQDWAGFAKQVQHQRSGGPSYLFGERRMTGWWYYYFVALAVKVPLTFWLLVVGRGVIRRVGQRCVRIAQPTNPKAPNSVHGGQCPPYEDMIPLIIGAYLTITALGSSRNYGVRYLLPLAPPAIVWVSALAEGGRWARRIALAGLIGQAVAVATVHPYELTYFNVLAGGPIGGRRILADSNLDWGQGLKSLARLQARRPEFHDLTLYYFGDEGAWEDDYEITRHSYIIDASTEHPYLPPALRATTAYLAVSASLQHGPWGPEGYFRRLDGVRPVAYSDDTTIAIYRTADLPRQ